MAMKTVALRTFAVGAQPPTQNAFFVRRQEQTKMREEGAVAMRTAAPCLLAVGIQPLTQARAHKDETRRGGGDANRYPLHFRNENAAAKAGPDT